jgi:hypothetical protein
VVELVVIENLTTLVLQVVYTASPLASPTSLPVSVTTYPITVGAGGATGLPISKVVYVMELQVKFSF